MGVARDDDPGIVIMLVLVGLVVCTVFALFVGAEAARRSRKVWVWGLLGAMFAFLPLIPLYWIRFLCPQCHTGLSRINWKERTCPACGDIGAASEPLRPFRKLRVDIYTMLLILTLLAITAATVCLYCELGIYNWESATTSH